MKEIIKENSKRSLVLNLAIASAVTLILILLFFYAYLPVTTNHGKTLEVPSLVGMTEQEVADVLEKQKLRYEIVDTTYSPDIVPAGVVRQSPRAGASVKKQRKIYLTINNINSPTVNVPSNIINGTLRLVEDRLGRVGLQVGEISKESDPQNIGGDSRLLGVSVDGERYSKADLEKGISVAKGTKIDLIMSKTSSESTPRSNADEIEEGADAMETVEEEVPE